ncbi:MAG: response regulator [Candidatus Alcyoniella australis]|nr:response regulator [Candidatus Alcyoniella australis]
MRVLVVDDERTMLETIRRGLLLYGHECLTAIDADEALIQIDSPQGEMIDLLLTDLTMPGKSGLSLIEQARTIRKELPVVVITGLNSSMDIQKVRDLGLPLLQKPFNPEQLDCTLREAAAAKVEDNPS